MFVLYKNANVLQPDQTLKKQSILVQDSIIFDTLDVGTESSKPLDMEIDLEGKLVFPGLINSHDHLIDTHWCKLGKTPVNSWVDWRNHMLQDSNYKLIQRLSVADLYTLGMYKNVISGVTSVADHFPPEISSTFYEHTLISLITHTYIAHSVSEQSLKWCTSIQEQYKKTNGILPFVIHIGEGNTKEISEELESLNRLGALNSNTILVNATFLEESDIQLIASKNASVVWLPKSSEELYGRQPNIKAMIDAKIKVSIGTDGSNTGSTTMQEEFKVALKYSKNYCNNSITSKHLIEMATINAAKSFCINKETGSIANGKMANFIVFDEKSEEDPYQTFINLTPEQIELVIHRGKMIYGNNEFRKVPIIDFNNYSEIKLNGHTKLIYGRPLQLLDRLRHKVGENISIPFFNIDFDD